jgi:hypothetical protein
MNCNEIICANSVTVNATNVVIDFSETVTLNDRERFNFRLCQSIPTAGASLPVVVTVNGETIPLWNKYGNPILSSELRCKRIYRSYYGATTPHVIVYNTPLSCCY